MLVKVKKNIKIYFIYNCKLQEKTFKLKVLCVNRLLTINDIFTFSAFLQLKKNQYLNLKC